MAFERLKTEIGILLTEMQNEPDDIHELALQIHGKLQEMRAMGMPLPADLVELEDALQSDAWRKLLPMR
ncbi:MAG: hypothetical protein SFW09_23420 [Hyphomicrobiaceae bacterium]|nr:hypothetical protein [Hyphomicrobiaceae bacterium]